MSFYRISYQRAVLIPELMPPEDHEDELRALAGNSDRGSRATAAGATESGPPGKTPGRAAVVDLRRRAGYFVRTTISAYGLVGATPPESAVTFAKPAVGTPKRA